MRSTACIAICGLSLRLLFSSAQPALANQDIATDVISTPAAPVALTHCSTAVYPLQAPVGSDNAVNRSDVFLTSYVVRWFLYDHSGIGMGQTDFSYSFQSDLAPGDSTSNSSYMVTMNEPLSALDHLKCRLESAKFEGGIAWTYGRPWHRRLSPLPRGGSDDK